MEDPGDLVRLVQPDHEDSKVHRDPPVLVAHLEHLAPLDLAGGQDRLDFLEILEPLEQLANQAHQDQVDSLVQVEHRVLLVNLASKVLQDQMVSQAPLAVQAPLANLVMLALLVPLDLTETKDQEVRIHYNIFFDF